jgi:hypothetical protein
MAELRDPNRRLLHELWASLEPRSDAELPLDPDAEPRGVADTSPFPALQVLGFGDWKERGR